MIHGRLTPLQSAVLDAFFGAEREFFLSGGGALVGFHLEHRETTDLDLFTTSNEAFERARVVLPNVVSRMGGTLSIRQDSPGFWRAGLRVEDFLAEANLKTVAALRLRSPIF